ncbi:JAB domain-containing protein, partial [archaeon]|nr:JAB domain-containing protein [archaeon]
MLSTRNIDNCVVECETKEKTGYRFTIKELPDEEKPRERLIGFGPSALSNAELLAIILRIGNPGENVLDLSKRLLKEHDIKCLSQVTVGELKKTFGVGDAKACQIIACFELGRRAAKHTNGVKPLIKTPQDVADLLMPEMQYLKKEYFKCLYLDSKNRIIKNDTISVGSLNANIVHPREVFKAAISESAASVILVHNHPSGDPKPSRDDVEITKRLMETGEVIGIKVLDHMIIGDGRWISL